MVFWRFQGVQKCDTGLKWVNYEVRNHAWLSVVFFQKVQSCITQKEKEFHYSFAHYESNKWGQFSEVIQMLTAQKMKFSIKHFFSIWYHLLKKSLMGNFILCAAWGRFKNSAKSINSVWRVVFSWEKLVDFNEI